jgi:hypothetical protein
MKVKAIPTSGLNLASVHSEVLRSRLKEFDFSDAAAVGYAQFILELFQ